jgi:DnaJ family protein B protein 12
LGIDEKEANKVTVVSRAFQVLSDPDKKAKFDRFGGDPDSRFPGASAAGASPFSNFARSSGTQRQGGPMWEEEISPEEMFRQFFGGGGGGFAPFGMLHHTLLEIEVRLIRGNVS